MDDNCFNYSRESLPVPFAFFSDKNPEMGEEIMADPICFNFICSFGLPTPLVKPIYCPVNSGPNLGEETDCLVRQKLFPNDIFRGYKFATAELSTETRNMLTRLRSCPNVKSSTHAALILRKNIEK